MGQQQLLLLVLGMVIVGIAVVAGIQAFSEGRERAAVDAAVSEALRIATDVQAWALKPAPFSGGGGSLSGVNFAKMGYTSKGEEGGTYGYTNDGKDYISPNGCYTISEEDGTVTIIGYEGTTSNGGCDTNSKKLVKVIIRGTRIEDINTETLPS